jgi:hypothetical protein
MLSGKIYALEDGYKALYSIWPMRIPLLEEVRFALETRSFRA